MPPIVIENFLKINLDLLQNNYNSQQYSITNDINLNNILNLYFFLDTVVTNQNVTFTIQEYDELNTLQNTYTYLLNSTDLQLTKEINLTTVSTLITITYSYPLNAVLTGIFEKIQNTTIGLGNLNVSSENFLISTTNVTINGSTIFDISGQIVKVDISGQRVDISGQRVDISGQSVDISGQRVDISGQRVDISGQTIDISGQRVDISGQRVDISGQRIDISGQRVDISGQRVDISGQRIDISGQRIDISGQRIDISGQRIDISGQRVDISGQTVDISGQRVDISGQRIDISGQRIDISGQRIDISGQTVDISGQRVDISGQTVDISGQRVDISGQRVDISGQRVDISGQRIDISGQRVDISGQRIDISGQTVDISGQRVDISGQRVDISGQRVDISGQRIDISGQRIDISGQRVDISGQRIDISGQRIDISGQRVITDISGQRVDISGQRIDISGQRVDISGQRVDISGQRVDISGQTIKTIDANANVPYILIAGKSASTSANKLLYSGIAITAGSDGEITTPPDISGNMFSSSAQTFKIVSTNANNTSGGTGIQSVRVWGIDSNYDLTTVDVSLNGITPVSIPGSFYFINKMETINGSWAVTANSQIKCYNGSTKYVHSIFTHFWEYTPWLMCPSGNIMKIKSISISSTTANGVSLVVWKQGKPNTFNIVYRVLAVTNFSIAFDTSLYTLNAGEILAVTSESTTATDTHAIVQVDICPI
jgi:hypothetical protein